MNQPALSAFIWSVADLLRGDYKQSEYGRVILPFTVLRRLERAGRTLPVELIITTPTGERVSERSTFIVPG